MSELEASAVRLHWSNRVALDLMTPSSEARYRRVFASYLRFVQAHGLTLLAQADMHVVRSFIFAVRTGGAAPASATSRFRLTVVRDAYSALQQAGLCRTDPTYGLSVQQLPQVRRPVPLTPNEVARLRTAGRISPRDHLRPAAVELALAGGSHLEIARAVVTDIDLRSGSARLGDRTVTLEPNAVSTLAARIAACRRSNRSRREGWDPSTAALALRRKLSTYPETSIAPGISSSLSRAMANAGLSRPGLRPASLREFAANRIYALHGVESVATQLGLDSLDVARGFIEDKWQEQYGEQVRAIG